MRKIIVVDPDKKFWKDVEKVVNTDICEVIFLENGQSLMGKLKEEKFDLIILNLELPDKNGFIFCNQIKKDANLKNIPVIITSSEKTEADFEQHKKLKVRAQEYLRKPISLLKLKNTIKSFLPDIILQEKAKKKVEKEKPLQADDFNEENIDKILDETFIGLIEEEPKPVRETITSHDTNALQQKIDSLVEENMALKQQIEELQQGSSAEKMLKEENEKLKDEIDSLNKKLEEYKNLKETGGELEKENEKLKTELEEFKKKANELQTILNQKKEELKELNVQLIALQKEKGFLQKENREHLMSITSLKADFEEKLQEQEKKLQEQENKINTLQTEKENLFEQLTSKQKEIEEKDRFITSLQEEVSRLKEDLNSLNEKLSNAEKELNELKELKSKAENQIIEQNTLISTLQKDLNISREAKAALEETVYDLKEELKTMQMEIEKEKQEKEELNRRLSEAEEKINNYTSKLYKIKEIISE